MRAVHRVGTLGWCDTCGVCHAVCRQAMSCRKTHLNNAQSDAAVHCPHAAEAATGPCATELLIPVVAPNFDCDLYKTTCVDTSITPAYADCAATVAANPGDVSAQRPTTPLQRVCCVSCRLGTMVRHRAESVGRGPFFLVWSQARRQLDSSLVSFHPFEPLLTHSPRTPLLRWGARTAGVNSIRHMLGRFLERHDVDAPAPDALTLE